jgi:hypothetical protein
MLAAFAVLLFLGLLPGCLFGLGLVIAFLVSQPVSMGAWECGLVGAQGTGRA